MKNYINDLKEMRFYLLLWFTQMISGLGSAMTAYALVIWSYTQEGSALRTALLMVCSYAPYVICSIFAGALSDKWDKKKTMLACDALAALSTLVVLLLLKNDALRIWHLYIVNAISGLMNTVQQPAYEVATTALLPRKFYQKVGGLRYLSSSLNSILTPIITTAIMGLWGINTVIAIDLISFLIAFLVLLFFIPIPKIESEQKQESVLQSAAEGIRWLKQNPGIFHLMLFLAAINLVASMYNAAFPAMMLSKASETVMGTVNSVIGITMLTGSILASCMPAPRSRVKSIWCCLMLSMCTENFFLAFGRNVWIWSFGATLGWIAIPWMNSNLDAINRLNIPVEIQGRVFAARNSFQFFTIPLGYFLGGLLVDQVFEPIMATQGAGSFLTNVFGTGKGSGAAFLFAVLWLAGIAVCLIFRVDKHIWKLEKGMRKIKYRIYRLSARAVMGYGQRDGDWFSFSLNKSATEQCKINATHEQEDNALFYQIMDELHGGKFSVPADGEIVTDLADVIFYMDFSGIFDRTSQEKKYTDRLLKAKSMFRPEGITLDFGSRKHRYLAFERSGSMSREYKLSFIREDLYAAVTRRITMDLTIGMCQLSKLYAYNGLMMSTGTRIDGVGIDKAHRVIVIDNPTYHHETDLHIDFRV